MAPSVELIRLSPRLALVASMVRADRPLADIGTDHAYLPAALLQQGKIPYAWCTDLRDGPLAAAAETVRRAGIEDKVTLVKSNGFRALEPDFCHDFVLAGMGGNLMSDILDECLWIRAEGMHFVLQPQSHQEDLRAFLYGNGFRILHEECVEDAGHLYLALEAEFVGTDSPLAKGSYTLSDCYIGELANTDDPLRSAYYQKVLDRLTKRYNGICTIDRAQDECVQLAQVIADVKKCI